MASTVPVDGGDDALLQAYRATRKILRAVDGAAAQRVLVELCHELGAEVVAAEEAPADALPIDLSLGETEPLLPVAVDPEVRARISRYLVPAVSDARTVADRGVRAEILVENATLDPLTGLWSRRPLTMAINRAAPGDALAMVDLDHFKQVNDTLGHDAGDEVLHSFGLHLRAQVRDGDVVGRLGGEEFVLLFPRTSIEEAVSILGRIARTWPDVAPHRLTFSAGAVQVVAPPDSHELPGQHAIKRADVLMYRAKESGRNVTLWE